MATHRNRFALALLALALFAGTAFAQYSGGGAWGRATKGDVVTIESPETGIKREETVGDDGKYRFERIPVGEYTVTITHADGTSDVRKVRVALGTNTFIK